MKYLFGIFLLLFASQSFGQSERSAIALNIVNYLHHGHPDSIVLYLDTSVRDKMPTYLLNSIWSSMEKSNGRLQDTAGVLEDNWNGRQVYVGLQFEETSLDLQLNFNAQDRVIGLFFKPVRSKVPYTPAPWIDTGKFNERRFTLVNDDYKLPGLLTIPGTSDTTQKFPLVILVHGSGPGSHKGEIGPNEVFTDMAQGLAMRGIASFRYDKRTLVYGNRSAVHPDSLTIEEEILSDVSAAVQQFLDHDQIDPESIYILGHSLGGYVAPLLAKRHPELKGIILAAAPARPLDSMLLEQYRYLDSLDPSGSMKRPLDQMEGDIAFLRSGKVDVDTDKRMLPLGIPAAYWLDLFEYDPLQTARTIKCRMLILQGEKDYQVRMTDYELWKQALIGKTNVQAKSYPDLGHGLFVGGREKGPKQYEVRDHVSRDVISDIATFIHTP